MSQVKDRLIELSKAIAFKHGNYTIQQLGDMKLGHVLRVIQQNGLDLRTEITDYPVPGVSGMADMSDDDNRPVQLVQLESKPDTMIEVIPVEGGYAIALDDTEHSIQLGQTHKDRDEAVKIAKYWVDVLHSFYHDPATCKRCAQDQGSQDQGSQDQGSQDQGSQHSAIIQLIAKIANTTPEALKAQIDEQRAEGKPLAEMLRGIVIASLLASTAAKKLTLTQGAEMMAEFDKIIEEVDKQAKIIGSDVETLIGIWLDARTEEESEALSTERILKPQLRKHGVSEAKIDEYINNRSRQSRNKELDKILRALAEEAKNDPKLHSLLKGLFDKGLDAMASRS